MSGVCIRDICSSTADKLQYSREELQTLIKLWEDLSSHPVGENDLWLYTYWIHDERVTSADRDTAFEAGLDLIENKLQRQHGFQAGSLVRRALERASWGMGDNRPLLIFTMLEPEDKAAFLDSSFRGSATLRPEAAETTNKFDIWAFHASMWRNWSCSGPKAGGGSDTEQRLAQHFVPKMFSPFRIHRSADARVGGVLGGYPPEVQDHETHFVFRNTNHSGPRINHGIPQGNMQPQFHEMLNELLFSQIIKHRLLFENRPVTDPKIPLMSLVVLLLVGILLFLVRPPSTPLHWITVRKCPGQYRRTRSIRAAGGTPFPPTVRRHLESPSRSRGKRPRLLFMLILMAMLHTAQAAPRSRSALKPPRKLAFLRARALSQSQAEVPYRGRLHDASTLGTKRCTLTRHAPRRKVPTQNRYGLRAVTWNSGGSHAARWTELLQWLKDEEAQQKPVHICLVQETH